ncbi:MAG TPA: hypothetical protein VMW27_12275 [Thermoanaerobaculia bacterium]|nr:hypothetical protein [Thermoanaerobaculia bacterium]
MVWVSKWVCLGYVWVANWVCVGWTWITHKFCVAWETIKWSACWGAKGFLWLLNGAAFVVSMIFWIPGLGPLARWLWHGLLTVFWGFVGLVDMGLCAIGVCPPKKLRLLAIVMVGERGQAVTTPAAVLPEVTNTIDLYRRLADVEVVPLLGGDKWVVESNTPAPGYLLNVDCGGEGLVKDLGLVGPGFDFQASVNGWDGNFRRLIGYGAPVIAFFVRDVEGSSQGCSFGPLVDYVTVESQPSVADSLPHEIGHACNLIDLPGAGSNLMNPQANHRLPNTTLEKGQVLLVRASRHVTYL